MTLRGFDFSAERKLMSLTLQVAVPLRLAELAAWGPHLHEARVRAWASDAADVVAAYGDALMFRTKGHKPTPTNPGAPGTAEVFNVLAKGVAALATCPGGVHVFGVLYCAAHHPGGIAVEAPCPECLAQEGTTETPAVRDPALRRLGDVLVQTVTLKSDLL